MAFAARHALGESSPQAQGQRVLGKPQPPSAAPEDVPIDNWPHQKRILEQMALDIEKFRATMTDMSGEEREAAEKRLEASFGHVRQMDALFQQKRNEAQAAWEATSGSFNKDSGQYEDRYAEAARNYKELRENDSLALEGYVVGESPKFVNPNGSITDATESPYFISSKYEFDTYDPADYTQLSNMGGDVLKDYRAERDNQLDPSVDLGVYTGGQAENTLFPHLMSQYPLNETQTQAGVEVVPPGEATTVPQNKMGGNTRKRYDLDGNRIG